MMFVLTGYGVAVRAPWETYGTIHVQCVKAPRLWRGVSLDGPVHQLRMVTPRKQWTMMSLKIICKLCSLNLHRTIGDSVTFMNFKQHESERSMSHRCKVICRNLASIPLPQKGYFLYYNHEICCGSHCVHSITS